MAKREVTDSLAYEGGAGLLGRGGRIVPRSRRRSTWGSGSARREIAHRVTRLWGDRVRFSRLAEQAVAYELSDTQELDSIARAFLDWSISPALVGVGVGARDRLNDRRGGHHGTQACSLQATLVLGDDRLPRRPRARY